MSRIVVELGIVAIALAGVLILVGARQSGWRVLAVGVILAAAAGWATRQPLERPSVWSAAEGAAWAGLVAGLCLRIIGVRWALWLMLPAALALALPLLSGASSGWPLWGRACAIALCAVLASILVIRGGQAVVRGVFGGDTAARMVGRWVTAILGSPGQSRQVRRTAPRLPRRPPPFNPHDLGGSR